jgi:hypothetical protein
VILPDNETLPARVGQPSALLQVARIGVAAAGLFIAILGALTGLVVVLILLFSAEAVSVDGAIAGLGFIVVGVGLGGALAWQGSQAARRQASTLFRSWPLRVLLLLYIPVLVIGQLLIVSDFWPALIFPPIHILAAIIPPLAILAFVARTLQTAQPRWRDIIIQLSGGAFLATFIALAAEIVLGLTVLFISLLFTALTPDGFSLVEEFVANLQDPAWVENPANVQQLLLFPPVAITLVTAFVIIGPLVEEIVKPLGVVLLSYRRPSPAQAFLWGVTGGAGFALIENLFNTTLGLEAWILIMLLRVGATAMHCLTTGLTALGWQRLLAERRPWKLIGAYGLSVAIHGLWNAVVVGISGVAIFAVSSEMEITQALSGGIILILAVFFIILTLAIIIALVILTHRLRAGLSPSPISNGA